MKLRLFKTRNFADAASRAWICDSELREAFGELLKGQADNLGGGVWKKRLKENRHRSIVLAKAGITGFINLFLISRDRAISALRNWVGFERWLRSMKT